jgi:hypothetical protein
MLLYVAYMKHYSTQQVADFVKIDRVTLERWIRDKKVERPKSVVVGARRFRLWSQKDVERISKVKARIYRKGRGRKPAIRGPVQGKAIKVKSDDRRK